MEGFSDSCAVCTPGVRAPVPMAQAGPPPFRLDTLETPAFVVDEAELVASARRQAARAHDSGFRLLYSLKALSIPDVLRLLLPHIDGFSASSLDEARLARSLALPGQSVHFTSPGLAARDLDDLVPLCGYVAFNSLSQLRRFRPRMAADSACGLRINPGRSPIDDARYDPCRVGSKLGVPLTAIPVPLPDGLGLHLHGNCESPWVGELYESLRFVAERRPDVLAAAPWLNLGGGYLLDELRDPERLPDTARLARDFGIERLYIEPGLSLVMGACWLVSEVIDLIETTETPIAVLDTTVNHMPEVFEYGYRPEVRGQCKDGPYRYTLAGASCLPGDLFGTYAFREPLSIGARLAFPDAGGYTIVRATTFNGLRLPTLYRCEPGGRLRLRRRFGYREFIRRSGGGPVARY